MAVFQAKRSGLRNFSMLVSHVLVPPAIAAIMELARQPRAGVSGRRARVQRDGHEGIYARWSSATRCRLW
jgi:hypothetical protein